MYIHIYVYIECIFIYIYNPTRSKPFYPVFHASCTPCTLFHSLHARNKAPPFHTNAIMAAPNTWQSPRAPLNFSIYSGKILSPRC